MLVTRWLLLANYCCAWVLAALLPGVLTGLGLAVGAAAAVASVLDLVRVAGFFALQRTSAWHNRLAPLAVATVLIPTGFFMVFFAPNVATALAGEVVFGLATAMTYYATFYYAMVVRNAAVDAGGGTRPSSAWARPQGRPPRCWGLHWLRRSATGPTGWWSGLRPS